MRDATLKAGQDKQQHSGVGFRKPVKNEIEPRKPLDIDKAVMVLVINALIEYDKTQERDGICLDSPRQETLLSFDDLYYQCYHCIKSFFKLTASQTNLQEIYPYVFQLVRSYKNSLQEK